MFRHILIPVDGSAVSKRIVQQGAAMARLCLAKLFVVHVISPVRSTDFGSALVACQLHDQAKANAKHYLDEARSVAEEVGVPMECETISGYPPHEAIVRTVAKKGCDLIIMGSHGRRGIARLLLGSETYSVLLRSDVPVMVISVASL